MHGRMPSRILPKLLSLTMLFASFCPALGRAEDFTVRQKRFIGALFREKDYFTCIAETRRLLAYSPGIRDRGRFDYFINANYFLGGQYRTVAARLARKDEAPAPSAPELLLLSASYLRLGLATQSAEALYAVNYTGAGDPWRYELLLRRVELHLREARYSRAVAETDVALAAGLPRERLDGLRLDLAAYRDIRTRSRSAAAALSALVPGAGQAYTGRYSDGAVSFIAVAALAAGTALSHRRGERGVYMTMGFFTGLVYAGNIYGAWNAAGAYNAERDLEFRERVTARHITPYDPVKYLDLDAMLR
jgi:hypothetical protein